MLPIYTFVFLEWFTLFYTFDYITRPEASLKHIIIATLSLGQISGYGFLYSHELFHRRDPALKVLGVLNLLKTLYLHYYSDHTLGHHKNVATPHDSTSSRLNQSVYNYMSLAIPKSFMDTWYREQKMLKKTGKSTWSIHNRMIQWIALEIIFTLAI